MSQLLLATASLFLLAAAATDVSIRVVPNAVSAVLTIDGVLAGLLAHGLVPSLAAALCVFVPSVVLWRHGLIGGGDAKLLTAVSLLVPASSVPSLVLTIAIAGGALALIYWLAGRVIVAPTTKPDARLLRRLVRIESYRMRRGFSLPYAVAISGGTLFTLSHGVAH